MSNLINNPFYEAGVTSNLYERYKKMFDPDTAAQKLKQVAIRNLKQEAIDMHPDHNNGNEEAYKKAKSLTAKINGLGIERTKRLLFELSEPFQTQLARGYLDLKAKYKQLLDSKKILFKTFANWLKGSSKDTISSKAGINGPLKLALINTMPWNEIVSHFSNNRYINLGNNRNSEICPYQLTIEENGRVVFNSLNAKPEKNKNGAKASDNEWLIEFDRHESKKDKEMELNPEKTFTPCFKVSKEKSYLSELNIVGSIDLRDIYTQIYNENTKGQVQSVRDQFKSITGSTEPTTISINNGKIKLPVIAEIDTDKHLDQYAETISNEIKIDNYLVASYLDDKTNTRKLCILGKVVDLKK